MFDRSGPPAAPRPRAMWHVAHCPLPEKNDSPAATSPAGWRSNAEALKRAHERGDRLKIGLRQRSKRRHAVGHAVPDDVFDLRRATSARSRRLSTSARGAPSRAAVAVTRRADFLKHGGALRHAARPAASARPSGSIDSEDRQRHDEAEQRDRRAHASLLVQTERVDDRLSRRHVDAAVRDGDAAEVRPVVDEHPCSSKAPALSRHPARTGSCASCSGRALLRSSCRSWAAAARQASDKSRGSADPCAAAACSRRSRWRRSRRWR